VACKLGFQRSPFRFTSMARQLARHANPLECPDTTPVAE
jgi:hypothetical protein